MAKCDCQILQKSEKERNIVDTGDLIDSYPKYWAMLMDKGSQGVTAFMRVVHPKKKNRILSLLWMKKYVTGRFHWTG